MCDIGWSDEKECRGCNKEEGAEKHRLYQCPSWREVRRNQISEGLEKVKPVTGGLALAKKFHVVSSRRKQLLEEKQLGSPKVGLGTAQELGPCQSKASRAMLLPMSLCWVFQTSGAHLDGQLPVHGMYGTLNADLEEQRTIEKAGSTAFLCRLQGLSDPPWLMWIIRESLMGFEVLWPKARDADRWISIWEEVHRSHQEGVFLEVVHVKAHRSKKEKQQLTRFQRFVKEGDEEADELAQDGGEMGQIRGSTVQQKKRGGFCGFAECSRLSLFGGGVAQL